MPLTFQRIKDGINQYRDTDTGDTIDSQNIIQDAIGNPVETGEYTTGGNTSFENGNQIGDKLYNGTKTARSYIADAGTSDAQTINIGDAPKSRFNSWNLFRYKSMVLNNFSDSAPVNVEDYSKAIVNESVLNPTAKKIVEWSQENDSLAYSYRFEDFIQCEHYGAISNNYMLTLRRFPYPIGDDILSPKSFGSNGEPIDIQQPDVARAVTWMSPTLGNDLKELFKFDVGFPWKSESSSVQSIQRENDRGAMGERIMGSPLLSAIEEGLSGRTAAQTDRRRKLGDSYDPLSTTYPNHVYGPLNVIKDVLVREQGLNFNQEFTLTFHYDLKGYGNTSPRVAFMDTLSNLLVLTYNNAPFWGGAARYYGHAYKPFGDFAKLKGGDYQGYLGSLVDQFSASGSNLFNDIKSGVQGFAEKGINGLADSKVLDQVIGGGLMKLFGSPQGSAVVAAFLTGDPTGQWHLTVGNPMNPAMVIGNLCMQDASFEFEGPLGYEDFPTKLKLTIKLKPGRPRDKGDIESMFNAGKGRMYVQPEGSTAVTFVDTDQYGRSKGKHMKDTLAKNISDMAQG